MSVLYAQVPSKPEPKQEPEETIQGQLAGVREFKVTDGRLGGLVHGGVWEPDKPHRATCAKVAQADRRYLKQAANWYGYDCPEPHEAPDYDCGCGYYAFHSFEEADRAGDGFRFPDRIRAVVSAWGDVVICDYGFRAEWMQVEAIIKQPIVAWGVEIDATAAWDKIAARYSVPVIEVSGVAEFCEALGTVVDGPGERGRAESEAAKRRRESMSTLSESLQRRFEKLMKEAEKKRNKPAFWRQFTDKKGRIYGE